ncbi:nucleotidyltransferase [Mesorhizobium sp. M0847]|uniref:nucleotidyltransferase domain-containing protein n=1 Tax=unclassified Mesorhizobium TaxID=325217 RepID=UPI003337EA46
MNMHLSPTITPEADDVLEDVAKELEIPEHRYEQAETSYKSLGDWLNRPESTIRKYGPQVHVQGSFGLGTVTPPLTADEHYDIDAVCEFHRLTKNDTTQANLKRLLEIEMRLYARSKKMIKPLEEHRRCWRQPYADEAQFHMDVTPGIPSGGELTQLLKTRGFDVSLAETAISITDNRHPHYQIIAADWQRSNPRGYLKWFLTRMAKAYEKRKNELLQKGVRAGTEPIPDYRIRTPLQYAIMILKRHRDIMYTDRSDDDKPISIILTTLAAHSYDGEEKIAEALFVILTKMDSFIGTAADGSRLIANPSDPLENFADKWKEHPKREKEFHNWLRKARADFTALAQLSNKELITEQLAKGVGVGIADKTRRRSAARLSTPALLTAGLVRSEAQARNSAVRIEGDRRNA